MIMHKYTKMETLSQIVNREFNADIFNYSKKQNNVSARKVFCKILNEIGFSWEDICGFMKKSYGVYMYYMADVENLLKYNPEVNEKYLICKDLFFVNIRGIIQEQNEYIVSTNSKINYSVWDKQNLSKVESKYDRIKRIIELVDFNTPSGKEDLIFEKLVHVFETISNDGEKTRTRKC